MGSLNKLVLFPLVRRTNYTEARSGLRVHLQAKQANSQTEDTPRLTGYPQADLKPR